METPPPPPPVLYAYVFTSVTTGLDEFNEVNAINEMLELLVLFRLQNSLLTQLQEDLNKSLQETIQKEVSSVLMEQSAFGNDSRGQAQQRNVQVSSLAWFIITIICLSDERFVKAGLHYQRFCDH